MAKLNPVDWKESFKWQFEAYPIFCSAYQKAAKRVKNKYYVSWDDFLCYFNDGHHIGLKPRDSVLLPGRRVINDLLSGNDDFLKIFKEIRKEMEEAIDACLKVRRNNEFADFKKWWPKMQNALSNASHILFGFDYALDEFLKDLQNNSPKDFAVLNKNIRARELSFINEAENKLIEFSGKTKNFNDIYDQFLDEYGWFQNSYKGIFKITPLWLKNYTKHIKNKKTKLFDNLKKNKLPKRYKLLAEAASIGIIFRDDKKKLLLIGVDLIEEWLKMVCEERGCKFEEMRWLTMDEILQTIKNKKNGNIKMAKRFAKNNARYGVLTKTSYREVAEKFWKSVLSLHDEDKNVSEIKGLTAHKGNCRGRIKVILNPKIEANKFKNGDVLVTSMTRPEFLPLMRKAAAFITDEGGITSHAAIISRELNKPCIIGTKIATKVLKDGDLVEVDADKGVVKIVKRA